MHQLDDYFVKYYVGPVLVDYCVNQLGGVEKFMSVYCDSVSCEEIYGFSLEELIHEALDHNKRVFQKLRSLKNGHDAP